MQYLTRALRLAEDRGYLRYPEVAALGAAVPDWFRRRGTPGGVAAFEARRGVRVPAAVREFYAATPLACFLEASVDGEVFLRGMHETDPPPLTDWGSGRHLVVAFHGHSGMVGAAALGADDPPVVWGFEDDSGPVGEAPVPFSRWVFGAVDRYEQQLAYWQAVYEKCQADPAEARRLGGVDWIRKMPGMAGRLGGG